MTSSYQIILGKINHIILTKDSALCQTLVAAGHHSSHTILHNEDKQISETMNTHMYELLSTAKHVFIK